MPAVPCRHYTTFVQQQTLAASFQRVRFLPVFVCLPWPSPATSVVLSGLSNARSICVSFVTANELCSHTREIRRKITPVAGRQAGKHCSQEVTLRSHASSAASGYTFALHLVEPVDILRVAPQLSQHAPRLCPRNPTVDLECQVLSLRLGQRAAEHHLLVHLLQPLV
jgi:hypothetical protein